MEREIEIEVVPLAEVPPEIVGDDENEHPLVLVVDGDSVLTDTRAQVLSRSGLKVRKAYDAMTALELARLKPPDLLLCNVELPGMTGIELAMAVAAGGRTPCRVLLVTTEYGQPVVTQALAAGCNFNSLCMPIHPSDLLQRVFDCLDWQPRRVHVPVGQEQDSRPILGQLTTSFAC